MSGSIYEASWGYGWETDAPDDFEGFGGQEPELNAIEFLESLEEVEKITSASPSPPPERSFSSSQRDPSPEQYAFNAAAYELTIKCLETGTKPSEKQLKKADPLFPEKKRSNRRIPEGALSRWKSFSSNLQVVEVELDGILRKGLNPKWEKSNRIIAYREDWPFIIDRFHFHIETGSCLSLRETIHAVSQFFITGTRRHGIPEDFIRARVSQCGKCDGEDSHQSKRTRKHLQLERWPEEHTIPWQQLDEFMENLCIRHRVSLRKESTFRIGSPEPSIVTTWVCSRGYRRQESGNPVTQPCSYRVRTIIPVRLASFPELNPGFAVVGESSSSSALMESVQLSDFQDLGSHESFFEQGTGEFLESSSSCLVIVQMNRAHRGHNPSEKEDYINFPVHPAAKEAVLYEFDLSWDVISVSRASLRMDMLLKSRASDIEKATNRFHLLPREVAQLAIEMNSQGKLASSDWARLLREVDAHRKKNGTIIFFQQYDVFNPVEEKQPFVCVIMTPWMREMAERFSPGNVWALDSTFKTCVRGLPLYAAAAPNQDGIGMPVFFMICSADTGSRHESIALRLAFAAVFKHLSVRPAAILIDKSRQTYDALSDVVSRDEKCWKNGKLVACRLLLCWFCVKKAWVEHLLPQVAPETRRDVYRRLDSMMLASSELEFNNHWSKFKEHYGARKEIMDYLELGWVGAQCPWRSTWPAFGRLFEHGSHETLNPVRHFWLFLKYSIFQGRVNHSNSDLLVALIGSASGDNPISGTLEEFYRQRQSLCDSRRYQTQASTSAERKRILAAECFLAQYNGDKGSFEVMSEPGFLFRLHNCGPGESNPRSHIVNLLTNFCDCLETKFTCEHLLAARLVLKHHFIAMYGLLERRTKEGDEPVTQVEDLDLSWLEERLEGSEEDRAMGIGSTPASASAFGEWDDLVQEVAHVQMQLSNLQACCEDQLLVLPVVDELSSLLASQVKSLRAFTGGSSAPSELHGGSGRSGVGIIQEHLKACKLQAQVRNTPSSASFSSSKQQQQQGSYAHAQTVVHPKLGFVHYYKQLKPARVSRRKCGFCGVYNVTGGSFEVTECRNCCRYLFYEILPRQYHHHHQP